MRKIIIFCLGFFLLFSCSEETESKHPYINFFFPYYNEAKFYIYRDVVQGLNEKIYRIYGVDDSYGKHIVVESYSMDGRLTEAYNYNVDSLSILDYVVVDHNGQKNKALLLKNKLFPMKENENTWFASKFPGFTDSTLFLSEIKRSLKKATPFKSKVMDNDVNTITTLDTLRLTTLNPYSKKEKEISGVFISYFAEGFGLVRMHDLKKKTDYILEKILTQEEYIKMINRSL